MRTWSAWSKKGVEYKISFAYLWLGNNNREASMMALRRQILGFIGGWKFLPTILFVSVLAVPEARSEVASLAGSWSGGGIVVYSSGDRERASCRAHYSGSGSHYSLSATCATPSGSISQNASIRKTGANSYSGSFFNSQFNVSGSIHVTVNGNIQHVRLSSSSGSASLTLRR
jgi:hypothetical protein